MGAAESKTLQKETEVGSQLPDSEFSRTRQAFAVSEDAAQRAAGLKRRTDGSLSPGRGIKKQRLSRRPKTTDDPDQRQSGIRVNSHSGASEMISIRPSWDIGVHPAELREPRQDGSCEFAIETSGQTTVQSGLPAQQPLAASDGEDSHLCSSTELDGAVMTMPDLDSQLAEISTELRTALVSLREPEDSMVGWKVAPAATLPETQRQTNQLIVRRVIEALRGVHLTPTLSAASLEKSTTTVQDYTLPGEIKHFFENVGSRPFSRRQVPEPEQEAAELSNITDPRPTKRRHFDGQAGSGRQHKRRRRSVHVDQYPGQFTGRLRRLTGLWRKDGWRNILTV